MQETQQEKGSEFLSIDLEHIRKQAMAACAAQFERIDAICLHNTQKVLQAYRECQISSYQFAGTSGYGYSDMGREKLDEVFAHVFKAEKALVRPHFVSGTHALATVLCALLQHGDTMISLIGAPYDTMQSVIGYAHETPHSLKEKGVIYDEVLLKNNAYDLEGIREKIGAAQPKLVLMQRSRGYSTRAQAIKGAVFAAAVFTQLGFKVSPLPEEERYDLIQTIYLENEQNMCLFCQGIQSFSPVDAHVTPIPDDMPGYADKIIMAAGDFVQGSSIELSADGPIREPYMIYLQGGIVFEHNVLAVMSAAKYISDHAEGERND